MRVLIVKRDKLGDLLLTSPVLARLRAALPDAEIHLLANDYNAWVVEGHPALARTWVYPRARNGGRLRIGALFGQFALRRALRAQRFDWAFVMGGDESHRGIRRAIASGARRVAAYAKDAARYGPRLTEALPPPQEGHETARMLALLAPLALPDGAVRWEAWFALPVDARDFARRWVAAQRLCEREYVVIGVGARRAKKQPTPDQIARWATRLFERYGLSTVFVWTPAATSGGNYPADDALAQAVIARALPCVHPFRGPIREAVALVHGARTSILPDSGLMHFAAASPGGVLGLFADPRDSSPAARWAPIGPRARYLEAAHRVAELSDDEVFGELEPLLA
jgi:heptosyltransferase-3